MSNFIITGFSDEISANFLEQLNEITKLGIAYIEIRGVNGKNITDHSIDEVKEIKKIMDAKGIKVSAIGSPIGKIHITEDFEPHFEKFKHTVEIAKILKTNYIRMFSFYMNGCSFERYRDEVINRIKLMVRYAEKENIVLLHENEKEIFGDIPERCLDLYKSINSNNFKLIFDFANFVQCGVENYPKAFNMLKDYVIYYHIKDAKKDTLEVVPPGYGDGNLPEIIKELKNRDYNGFLSLEPHLGNFVGFNNLENNENLKFKETSDITKFKLSYTNLMKIINKEGGKNE